LYVAKITKHVVTSNVMSDEVVDDGLRESMLSVNVTLLQAFSTLTTGDGEIKRN